MLTDAGNKTAYDLSRAVSYAEEMIRRIDERKEDTNKFISEEE